MEYGRQSSTLYVIQNPCEDGEERFNMAIGLKVVSEQNGGTATATTV